MNRDKRERGSVLVEYALVVSLIAVICIASVRSVGSGVINTFDNTSYEMGATRGAGEGASGPPPLND